jgi:hypothetical protein
MLHPVFETLGYTYGYAVDRVGTTRPSIYQLFRHPSLARKVLLALFTRTSRSRAVALVPSFSGIDLLLPLGLYET